MRDILSAASGGLGVPNWLTISSSTVSKNTWSHCSYEQGRCHCLHCRVGEFLSNPWGKSSKALPSSVIDTERNNTRKPSSHSKVLRSPSLTPTRGNKSRAKLSASNKLNKRKDKGLQDRFPVLFWEGQFVSFLIPIPINLPFISFTFDV